MSSFIDTHIHLADFKQVEEIINKIVKTRQYTLCVSNSPEEYTILEKRKVLNKYVKVALGFHPQNIKTMKFNSFLFMKNIATTKYIGEVGLDFSKQYIEKATEQKKIFEFICDIASKNNKLLSIHCVKAEEDLLEIMERFNIKYAIIHWYSGNTKDIYRFINKGYYFGINSKMIRTNKFKELIKAIPKNKILVESDAPYTINSDEKYFNAINLTYNELNKYEITSHIIYENFRELLNKIQQRHV